MKAIFKWRWRTNSQFDANIVQDLECVATYSADFPLGSSVRYAFHVSGLYILLLSWLYEGPLTPRCFFMPIGSPLDLRVPRNFTATLQLVQRLVGRDHHQRYCSGVIPMHRLPAFLEKMAHRYPPILRTTRERSYDRLRRGRAAMHMLIFESPNRSEAPPLAGVQWLLLSDTSGGGLADLASPDFQVAKDAMAANGHIEIGDYVLLYANKRRPSSVIDRRSGRTRTVLTDTSTWTWKIRNEVLRETRLAIDACCQSLDFGALPTATSPGTGVVGLLAAQRDRPLFSGVRNQVIDLYRYAAEHAWPPYDDDQQPAAA